MGLGLSSEHKTIRETDLSWACAPGVDERGVSTTYIIPGQSKGTVNPPIPMDEFKSRTRSTSILATEAV